MAEVIESESDFSDQEEEDEQPQFKKRKLSADHHRYSVYSGHTDY